MTRTIPLAAILVACLSLPASAETIVSGTFDVRITGGFYRFVDGATSEITTVDLTGLSGKVVFSAGGREWMWSASVGVWIPGTPYSVGASAEQPMDLAEVYITDSAPGTGPDSLGLIATPGNNGPGTGVGFASGGMGLFDPSGLFFETGILRPGGYLRGSAESQYGSLEGNVTTTRIEFEFIPVPEPSSLAMLGTALCGLGAVIRRRMA